MFRLQREQQQKTGTRERSVTGNSFQITNIETTHMETSSTENIDSAIYPVILSESNQDITTELIDAQMDTVKEEPDDGKPPSSNTITYNVDCFEEESPNFNMDIQCHSVNTNTNEQGKPNFEARTDPLSITEVSGMQGPKETTDKENNENTDRDCVELG